MRKYKTYTEEQQKYIFKYYNDPKHSIKGIANYTGSTYGMVMRFLKRNNLEVDKDVIDFRKSSSRLQKGHKPFNKGRKMSEYITEEGLKKIQKTQFKKGNLPHNYKTGEFVTKDGYVVLSVGESKQRLKHVYNWEQVNGELPEGYCLRCKSDDIQNCDPSNWKLITREENMLLNSRHKPPRELVKTMALNSKLKKQIIKLEENGK